MKPKPSLFLGCAGVLLFLWLGVWSVLLAFFYFHGASPGNSTSASGDDFKIKFGIVEKDSNGDYFVSQETDTIPMKYQETGFLYGMTITPPDDKPYTYQCTVHFSSAPKVLSGPDFAGKTPSTTITTDERSVQGTVSQVYGFDHGDPSGEQSIDLKINGKLVKTIKFTVVEEK